MSAPAASRRWLALSFLSIASIRRLSPGLRERARWYAGGVTGGRALAAIAIALALTSLAACASAPAPAASGTLRVACTPDDAEVYLDDRFAGACAVLRARPLAAAAGLRRVEIRRPGHFTRYVEAEVRARASSDLRVDLRKSPEP